MSGIISPSHAGVVSLLDMLKFNAHTFVVVSRLIASIGATYEMGRRTNPHMGPTLDAGAMPDSQVTLEIAGQEMLKQECHQLLLHLSEDHIDKTLITLRTRPVSWGEISRLKNELASRIEDELKRRIFYQLKPGVAEYFDMTQPFGKEVHEKFGSASHDIEEACKCYACERYDATAYHLMRAMESPLKCLAKTLHVKYTPGWAGYLNRVDKKLRNQKRLPKARREFLSNASVLLWSVKDAWRNETMHLERQYSPEQAGEIFRSTKAFMVHLASGLHE